MTQINLSPIRIGILSPEDAYSAIQDASDINYSVTLQQASDVLTSIALQLVSSKAPRDLESWEHTFRRTASLAGMHAPEVRDRLKAFADLLKQKMATVQAKDHFLPNDNVAKIARFLIDAGEKATLAEISEGTLGTPDISAILLTKMALHGIVDREGYGMDARYSLSTPDEMYRPRPSLKAEEIVSQPAFMEIDEDIYPWGKGQ